MIFINGYKSQLNIKKKKKKNQSKAKQSKAKNFIASIWLYELRNNRKREKKKKKKNKQHGDDDECGGGAIGLRKINQRGVQRANNRIERKKERP